MLSTFPRCSTPHKFLGLTVVLRLWIPQQGFRPSRRKSSCAKSMLQDLFPEVPRPQEEKRRIDHLDRLSSVEKPATSRRGFYNTLQRPNALAKSTREAALIQAYVRPGKDKSPQHLGCRSHSPLAGKLPRIFLPDRPSSITAISSSDRVFGTDDLDTAECKQIIVPVRLHPLDPFRTAYQRLET